MSYLFVGFLGALVGGAFGVLGAWIGGRHTFNATRMAQQRLSISEARTRLVTLRAPAMKMVWTIHLIVHEQAALVGGESVEARDARHMALLESRRLEMEQVIGLLALEPSSGALQEAYNNLWLAFRIHMARLRVAEPGTYSLLEQRAAVDNIDALVLRVDAMLKAPIAALDAKAAEVIGLDDSALVEGGSVAEP